MKYCPNEKCPHFEDIGSHAEFVKDLEKCPDCGAELVAGEAPSEQEAESEEAVDLVTNASAAAINGNRRFNDQATFFQPRHFSNVKKKVEPSPGLDSTQILPL